MENLYNLSTFKLSIQIYNTVADNLLTDFREAISNELHFNSLVHTVENKYGIKLDLKEFNNLFKEQHQELVEQQSHKLNAGIVFSFLAALVCELSLKYLILKSGTSFPKKHNLKYLYENLEVTYREDLKRQTMKKCKFISEFDFHNQLNETSENFVSLRYFYEQTQHNLGDLFLKGFKDSLIELL